ncbi:MAG TPA: phosphoenolpyruvate--protein phosphotransferase [Gammaproteobacteria bacterium]|nr:phosphoenolpyruvate--protein phosphotransferase [Gammaproteobacteria bacterium]
MLRTLRRIIHEVSNAQDFKEALDIMIRRVAKVLDAPACSIFLLDHRLGEYILMATKGLNPEAVGRVRIPLDQGLIGFVGDREEPLNLADAKKHPHFRSFPELKNEKYQAFLGVPIIYHRQVLGVFVVERPEDKRFDESQEAFLVTVSAQLAAVIAHAEATGEVGRLYDVHVGKDRENTWSGIPGAPGIGIGTGVVVFPMLDLMAVPDRTPDDIEIEIRLLEVALAAGREDFRVLSERFYPNLPLEERSLFEVYQRMLDTTDLGAEIVHAIRRGNWAQGALREVIAAHVKRLENLENDYMRERAIDIKDLGHRILAYLQRNERVLPQYAERSILIGDELTAADLAEVPEGCLAGVVSGKGTSTSHVAILARAMGVPTVMGVSDIPIHDMQDKDLIIDGYYGQIYLSPNILLREEYQKLALEEHELTASLEALRDEAGQTANGERVSLMVNMGLGADIALSLAAGAEGVGLYRTETPFLVRDSFPTSEEQRVLYRQMLTSFSPRPVTMRTLDIGGDKALSYFPLKEDNPFLGWRGIRITLDHPEIFLTQVRAMMRASEGYHNLRIMLPMVTDVSEVDEATRLLKKAFADVREEGFDIVMPEVGVMIEVPAAVYQARAIARRVDFLSVGSNDLTQYLLAVDRNNARVASLFDSLHPAVLRALIQVIEGAHQEGKRVAICGELAADPAAVLLLVAMGFDSLSMSAWSLSRIKWVIRQFTRQQACQLLEEVLGMESVVMIRCHLEMALEQAGLGGLIRAGKR